MAVDLTIAKQHCRVTSTAEDALLAVYLAAAKAWVENFTNRKLTRGSVTQDATAFDAWLPLHWGPDPAELTITYTDTDGNAATVTDALIVGSRAYPETSWPSTSDNTPVTLTYTAGYSTTPSDLDNAVLLLTGDYFDRRSAGDATPSIAVAVASLCGPYRALRI